MTTTHGTEALEIPRAAEIPDGEWSQMQNTMRQYYADGEALDAQVDDLIMKYGEIWAAMYDGQLFTGPSPDGVYEQLRAAAIPLGEAVIQYLTDKPVFHIHAE